MASTKFSLKLLFDKNRNKVLFAEAGKDFIDFLFNLLSLPISTIVSLQTKNGMVGSLSNLYESIQNLDDTYIQPNQAKDFLLKPKVSTSSPINLSGFPLPENEEDNKSVTPKLYLCGQGCHHYVAEDGTSICPDCGYTMNRVAIFVRKGVTKETSKSGGESGSVKRVKKETSKSGGESGFVKGVVTYLVTDDLVVQPAMSTISSITLLKKFCVDNVHSLHEMVVAFGTEEGMKLLKASMQGKSVLTSVFLKKNA